jgi:hypothetical protein
MYQAFGSSALKSQRARLEGFLPGSAHWRGGTMIRIGNVSGKGMPAVGDVMSPHKQRDLIKLFGYPIAS